MNFHSRLVSELMHIDHIKCDPKMSVLDAAKLMSEKGHGSLLVVERSLPLGIVTERDVLSKLVAEGKSSKETQLSSIMTSPVITIHPEADITAAARAMVKNKIRRLVVVADDELMGVLSDSDILGASTDLIATSEDIRNLVCAEPNDGDFVTGYCEGCKAYSSILLSNNGELLCNECRDSTA